MSSSCRWKLTIIGGGSRIAGAALCYLANRLDASLVGEVALYGRTRSNMEDNIKILDAVCPPEKRSFTVSISHTLESALEGADIAFYNATSGLDECDGYKSLGIPQGAHIMHVAGKIKQICPEAWFLINTNPPDVPLAAVHKKLNLHKLIGCCNAAVITKKVLYAYLCASMSNLNNYAVSEEKTITNSSFDTNSENQLESGNNIEFTEADIQLYEIGVNHDLWFYDILLKGKSIYGYLRENLPVNYNENLLKSDYLESFPEWKYAFKNNIELLRYTNYLPAPVGGAKRFKGLPLSSTEIGKMMKRPTREDFQRCIRENLNPQEIMSIISRCGGGIPAYIVDLFEAIITDSGKVCSVQVLNNGTVPCYPQDVMLQLSCKLGRNKVERPVISEVPGYIIGALSPRIFQNDMAARALAEQDEKLMIQAMLMIPERAEVADAVSVVKNNRNVEPVIPLN